MGLQVRLRHALGERVLELPGRTVDNPVVVGRAGDADVQIPSIAVGPQHIVLFIHEGKWVVQDTPGGTGTRVNGQPLSGPRALQAGDVLKLGPDPNAPTIEIEPERRAASRPTTAAVAATALAPRTFASPPPAPPVYAPPPPPPPTYASQPVYHEPAHVEPEVSVASGDGDEMSAASDWTMAAPGPRTYYVPKRRKNSDASIALAVIVTVSIVAGAGIFIYLHQRPASTTPPQQAVAPAPPAPVVPATHPVTQVAAVGIPKRTGPVLTPPPPPKDPTDQLDEPVNMEPDVRAKPKPRPDVPKVPNETSNASPPRRDSETFTPEKKSDSISPEDAKAWAAVENAYFSPNLAKALLMFDSWEEDHPSVHRTEVQQYREEVLDKLWWQRIDDLFEKKKDLAAAIKKTEGDIQAETEAAYKKTVLEPRLADQKARLAKIGEKLTKGMGYKSEDRPPIGRETELRALREKRDKKVYEEWKPAVLKHVRDTHGSMPWANEK
jgi:hypothetical protein